MPDDLVTIASYPNSAEAEVARLTLDAEGIKGWLANEGLVTNVWLLGNAVGYVKLQVATSVADRARVLLRTAGEWPSDAEEEASAGDEEEAELPVTADGDEEAARAWRAAIFGLMFCPLLLYSVYVLICLVGSERPLSSRGRRHVVYALLVDAMVFGFLFAIFKLT
jgi:hypothetical protein